MKDIDGREFSLRPATEDDLAQIVEIERSTHAAPWALENLGAELQKNYSEFLVFTDDDTDSVIAGYLVFHLLFEVSELLNLVVVPQFRRQGFGREMLRFASLIASRKNALKIGLDVRKSNAAGIALYQGFGFSICQIHRQFYSDGEDSYRMELILGTDFFKLIQ